MSSEHDQTPLLFLLQLNKRENETHTKSSYTVFLLMSVKKNKQGRICKHIRGCVFIKPNTELTG